MVDDATLVQFDVLVAADEAAPPTGSGMPPRPGGDRVTQCRRWFAAHGAECDKTGFGLACRMPRAAAEALFGVPATTGAQLPPPPELAHLITQITVPAAPELF